MEALQTINLEERRKDTFLKIVKPSDYDTPADRPGWIPPDITHEWNTDPYAYQTEEELMPGGGLHGRILAYMMAILQDFIETRDMMLLMDTFMLYRDARGVKQRIAPDLLLMPFRYEPPSAYDLEIEATPLLRCDRINDKIGRNIKTGIQRNIVLKVLGMALRRRYFTH